jgi:hypothetical protein
MNSLGLVALVLGIISVVITLKYVNSYERLDNNLNKINSNCQNKSTLSEIIKIQDSLDLSDTEMNKLIKKNRKAIKKLFNKNLKESFVNYPYTDSLQRGLGDFNFTNIIKDD